MILRQVLQSALHEWAGWRVETHATFSGGVAPLRGKEAVAQGGAPYFKEGGPALTWKPIKAEVLVGGDVG